MLQSHKLRATSSLVYLGLLTGTLAVLPSVSVQAQTNPPRVDAAQDLQTIKSRYYNYYLGKGATPENFEQAVSLMRADGGYPDLDYVTQDKVNLPSFPHLQRLGDLAAAYRYPESPQYGKPELKERISRGLDYWFIADPRSGNWWYNDMGAPGALAKVLILFEAELTPDQRSRGIAVLKRGYADGSLVFGKARVGGQNLLWIADLLLQVGCLDGDYNFAAQAAQAAAQEIKISKGREGIQPDMSFHQHGPMLYSGGYGKAFPVFVTQMASMLRGTSLAMPPDKLELVARYLFDGQQWMIRGGNFDFGTIGRAVSRKQEGANAGQIARALRALGDSQSAYAAQADIFAKRVQNKVSPADGVPAGNRMFWNSDYMSQQQPGYLLGIKAVSTRTVGSESGNREALKNYYMSTGVTCLMKTGKEYEGIFPLWNWRMLPGITCALSDASFREINWGKGSEGTRTFVGGASDGKYGVMAYDFNRDGVAARKAWFCFDDTILCLGAGVQSETNSPIATTIEQNWHAGGVLADHDGTAMPVATGAAADLTGARWLLHGTTGYYFPARQNVRVQIEQRTGSWRDIGKDESPAPVTGEIFSAWIDHGMNPQDGTYAYAILPNTTRAGLETYAAPQVLVNTAQQQAVWHAQLKMLEAVFYEPSQITLPGDYGTLAVDKGCVLTARANGNSWTISVADPTQSLPRIEIKLRGRNPQTLTLELPQGDDAGRTGTAVLEGVFPAAGLASFSH